MNFNYNIIIIEGYVTKYTIKKFGKEYYLFVKGEVLFTVALLVTEEGHQATVAHRQVMAELHQATVAHRQVMADMMDVVHHLD